MLHGYLLCLLSLSSVYVSANRNHVASSEVAQFQLQRSAAQRQGQAACSAPSNGCGYGLWNEESCECECIPDHCFDETFQSCISSPGSCPNAFDGCTKYVNCPFFANPMVGNCESSDTIAPAVYVIFRTAEECCAANYPESSSCIPTAPPTASPSPEPVATTETQPPVIPPVAEATIDLAPISMSFDNLPPQFGLNDEQRGDVQETLYNILTSFSDSVNATIVSLDILNDISSLFSDEGQILRLIIDITVAGGAAPPGEINLAFVNRLQNQRYEIANVLQDAWGPQIYTNHVILSIDGVETTSKPSLRPTAVSGVIAVPVNHNDNGGSKSLPIWSVLLIVILLSMLFVGLLVWHRRRDKHRDIPSSSHNPYFEDEIYDETSKSRDQSFHRSRVMERPNHIVSNVINQSRRSSTGTNFNESRQSQMSFQSRQGSMGSYFDQTQQHFQSPQSNMDNNFNESRDSQSCQSNISINFNQSKQSNDVRMFNPFQQPEKSTNGENTSQIDPEGTKSFEQSMYFTESAADFIQRPDEEHNRSDDEKSIDIDLNPDEIEIMNEHSTFNRVNQGEKSGEEEIVEESGYDGGMSSLFNLNVKADASDDDSSQEVSDGSSDDGNVLGLLYYDGASSAGESEARESRKSRRSGRTSRSRHSSGKSSSGKSSRNSGSRSSKSQKPRRKKPKPLKHLAEGTDYQQEHNQITKPTSGDNVSGSIVYATSRSPSEQHGALDGNAFMTAIGYGVQGRPDQSAFSHGSTIKTADSHHERYARNNDSWEDNHEESFNSAGECIADLNNNPEVKF